MGNLPLLCAELETISNLKTSRGEALHGEKNVEENAIHFVNNVDDQIKKPFTRNGFLSGAWGFI
jgi:hypothetical protein